MLVGKPAARVGVGSFVGVDKGLAVIDSSSSLAQAERKPSKISHGMNHTKRPNLPGLPNLSPARDLRLRFLMILHRFFAIRPLIIRLFFSIAFSFFFSPIFFLISAEQAEP